MPVQGLPKALKAILESFLSNTFAVKSWQIFSEGEGACVKIRFRPSNIGESTMVPQEQCKWKKASPSQVKRDRERSAKHSMQLRSRNQKTVEVPRNLDNEPQSHLDISKVTVESVSSPVSDCSSQVNTSPLSTSDCQIRPVVSPEPSEWGYSCISDQQVDLKRVSFTQSTC